MQTTPCPAREKVKRKKHKQKSNRKESTVKKIHIDIETYSSVDLGKSGVYRYAESDDFEIILFGYAVDDGDVKVVDLLSGEKIPEEIIEAIGLS